MADSGAEEKLFSQGMLQLDTDVTRPSPLRAKRPGSTLMRDRANLMAERRRIHC